MKAIHAGKTKNDKIDALKIAKLIRGGNFPLAIVEVTLRESRSLFHCLVSDSKPDF
jgi:hypothetical protein